MRDRLAWSPRAGVTRQMEAPGARAWPGPAPSRPIAVALLFRPPGHVLTVTTQMCSHLGGCMLMT